MKRFAFSLAIIAFAVACGGCTTLPPSAFRNERPVFEPEKFFTGHTRSSGVVETRGGAPMKRVTTETSGRWKDGTLHLEQELVFDGKEHQHRSWRIRRLDAHRYEATANDMIGAARGQAFGNAFTWSFTLALSPGNPFTRIRMTQWMYLQPDGRTMINHTTIRKAGIVVAQVSEQFRRKR